MEQPATQDPLIGARIGNYEIKLRLGVGGMGTVYLAEHPLIGKKVALKVLHPEFSSNEEVVNRFFHEAKAVNDIQHPNIVDILDYGVIGNGVIPGQGQNTVYFIMEFLDGMSLADLIRREAPLVPERALAIGVQMADALGASHSKGIVHRDLKPDNIMLIQRGREADFVKVLDFGIAKLTGDPQGSKRTRTGIVMGTPAYMSPEQCEGRGNVDHRTDVYALGILLYEMLTGQVPFTGEGYGEILVKHLTQPPPPPSTVRGVLPPHLEVMVLKALEKSPDARYPSMDVFMKALADPVGYVESHGGISHFMGTPSSAAAVPMAGSVVSASNPIAPLTPAPGQVTAPMAGQPMTPHAGPGMSRGRRIALIASVAVLFLALAVGGYALLQGAGRDAAIAQAPSDARTAHLVMGEPDSQAGPPEGPDPEGEALAHAADAPEQQGDADTPDPAGQQQAASSPPSTEEPEEPEEVSIKIISHPDGAAVFVGKEDEPRGRTPLTFHLPRSADRVAVTIRRSGYEDIRRVFEPSNNKEFDLQLRRERRSHRSRGNRNRGHDRRGAGRGQKNQDKNKRDQIRQDVMLEEPDWD